MVKPTWPGVPADWEVRQSGSADPQLKDTGWTVTWLPPGFAKIVEGFRHLHGKRQPVAHLVYVGWPGGRFGVRRAGGGSAAADRFEPGQGGLNIFVRQQDGNIVTVMGEVPVVTVWQIANSVTRR